ncbi:MAG: flagellar protein FlgN [Spirochaetes bacterium]|nr:flagellar protein FlgN [Spirochaetota bacterium]
MSKNLIQLEHVLSEELRIFSNILRLEREKSDAIIKKNGALMQKLSTEQEDYLYKIAPVESTRKKITDQYLKNNSESKLTLTDIAAIEGISESTLEEIGTLLKKTLDRIKTLQETNAKMITDNLEFFKKMIKGVKKSVSMETGYSRKGMENSKTINSFVLDKKI